MRSAMRSGALSTGRRLAAGAVLSLLAVISADGIAAQSWETVSASRRASGSETVDVLVRYGAGRLQVRPGDAGDLYRMELRYDADHFEPVIEANARRLELGTRSIRKNLNLKDGESGLMEVELGTGTPMDLVLEFGAVRANLDLGGLHLTDLELSTGASESTVEFSEPTRGRVRNAVFQVGAADFSAENLGNLRADRLEVSAGVGEVTLDFGGDWEEDMRVDVSMGLGALEILVPRDVAVRLNKDSFLTSLDADWMDKEGDSYFSENWDDARHRLVIDVDAAFGSIEIRRIR